jgi:histidinol-phosphate phosphatase family protein
MEPAVFIDRDGVINENPPAYVKSWDEFHFLPGVIVAMKQLAECPWPIVIITNQSVVGRGIIELDELNHIHNCMVAEITAAGGRIDGIYVCPHHPDQVCECRKPAPGLLLKAAEEMSLDRAQSLLIGDSWSDVDAAIRSEVQPVLVWHNQSSLPIDLPVRQLSSPKIPVTKDLATVVRALVLSARDRTTPANVIYYLSDFPIPKSGDD